MAERLRRQVKVSLTKISWSRKWRGFKSHSHHHSFCFFPRPSRATPFCPRVSYLYPKSFLQDRSLFAIEAPTRSAVSPIGGFHLLNIVCSLIVAWDEVTRCGSGFSRDRVWGEFVGVHTVGLTYRCITKARPPVKREAQLD